MRKPKFKVGQSVHVVGDQWQKDFTGKIIEIRVVQDVTTTKDGDKISTQIQYMVKDSNGRRSCFLESRLYGNNSALYKSKRNKKKANAKRSLTRAKNTLAKNEAKLAAMKAKLVELEKGQK